MAVAGAEAAGADATLATFSIDAAPTAGASAVIAADGCTAAGCRARSAACAATTGCASKEGDVIDPLDSIPNFTTKYIVTTQSASSDIHTTRFNGVMWARRRTSRWAVPSMVAKMLGPKSGCRGLAPMDPPNN